MFDVIITVPSHVSDDKANQLKNEVAPAVWAWILFGGVGARTRRGCGSLFCDNWPFTPLLPDPRDAIKKDAEKLLHQEARKLPIPSLKGAGLLFGNNRQVPGEAWCKAVGLMQDFRQGVKYGRNEGQQDNRPEPSRWLEPDSLRQMAGTHSSQHPPVHEARLYFPRADLGLPIIFHFKDQGDPANPDPCLQGAQNDRTRMASPIILKPLAVSPTTAYTMVLGLDTPAVWSDGSPGVSILGKTLPKDELFDKTKSAAVFPLSEQSSTGARRAFGQFAVKKLKAKGVML